MQVGMSIFILLKLSSADFVLDRALFSAQVLHLLGPKTEADLEKKPKVYSHSCM